MSHGVPYIAFFGIAAVAACGSSTSSSSTMNSGASSGGGSHAAQSSSSGAGVSGTSGSSSGGGGSNAAGSTSSSAGSNGSSSGGVDCYVLMGTGASQICTWDTSPLAPTCGAQMPGKCPSAGLVGCCRFMGASGESANCYYSSSSAQTGMAYCAGTGGTWQTTAP